jgi:hypothetical protein
VTMEAEALRRARLAVSDPAEGLTVSPDVGAADLNTRIPGP